MKDEKRKRVFLYFLRFAADDLKVYYDQEGIAAVAYCGDYEFLKDTDTIRHCFEEGYVDREGPVALILYAYTDDESLASSFEAARDMNQFVKKTIKFTKDEFSNLKRFKEGELSMESLLYAPDQYIDIAMNQLEVSRIADVDEIQIIADWSADIDIFDILPLCNGYSFNDGCLEEALSWALQTLRFKYILGEEEIGPADPGIRINEWNVFYSYFSSTLC